MDHIRTRKRSAQNSSRIATKSLAFDDSDEEEDREERTECATMQDAPFSRLFPSRRAFLSFIARPGGEIDTRSPVGPATVCAPMGSLSSNGGQEMVSMVTTSGEDCAERRRRCIDCTLAAGARPTLTFAQLTTTTTMTITAAATAPRSSGTRRSPPSGISAAGSY